MSLDMSSMKKILPVLLICLLMLAGGTALYVPDVAAQAPAAEAEPAPLKADPGDTAWILTSSALADDTAGVGALLWGIDPEQEHPEYADALLHHSLSRQYYVGVVRLQPVFRP